MKNPNDPKWNRTRDFLACSEALHRVPFYIVPGKKTREAVGKPPLRISVQAVVFK